jgi:hypothetical protein
MYIRQKNSNTYVITDGFNCELNTHPSIVQHPEIFEITSEPPTDNSQYLQYEANE